MAFAHLKQSAFPTEFITEQARIYIANLRFNEKLKPTDPVALSDYDQIAIMRKQLDAERVMKAACGPDTLILCDSSALNALFYMSESILNGDEVQGLIKEALEHYDVVYYASPLESFPTFDPNRVHDKDFAQAMDLKIPGVCKAYLPSLKISKALTGTPDQRMMTLVGDILGKFSA